MADLPAVFRIINISNAPVHLSELGVTLEPGEFITVYRTRYQLAAMIALQADQAAGRVSIQGPPENGNGGGGNGHLDELTFSTPSTVEVRMYVRTSGNDTTGNGTLASPYRTLQRALTSVPPLLPPGVQYFIDITGITEQFPADYVLPSFTGDAGLLTVAWENSNPAFPLFRRKSTINIYATPQVVQTIDANTYSVEALNNGEYGALTAGSPIDPSSLFVHWNDGNPLSAGSDWWLINESRDNSFLIRNGNTDTSVPLVVYRPGATLNGVIQIPSGAGYAFQGVSFPEDITVRNPNCIFELCVAGNIGSQVPSQTAMKLWSTRVVQSVWGSSIYAEQCSFGGITLGSVNGDARLGRCFADLEFCYNNGLQSVEPSDVTVQGGWFAGRLDLQGGGLYRFFNNVAFRGPECRILALGYSDVLMTNGSFEMVREVSFGSPGNGFTPADGEALLEAAQGGRILFQNLTAPNGALARASGTDVAISALTTNSPAVGNDGSRVAVLP